MKNKLVDVKKLHQDIIRFENGKVYDQATGKYLIKVMRVSPDGFTPKKQSISLGGDSLDNEAYAFKGVFCFCRLFDSGAFLGLHKPGYDCISVTYLPEDAIVFVQEFELDDYDELEDNHINYNFTKMKLGDYHDKWVIPNKINNGYMHLDANDWHTRDNAFNHADISSYRYCEMVISDDICKDIESGLYPYVRVKTPNHVIRFEEEQLIYLAFTYNVLDRLPDLNLALRFEADASANFSLCTHTGPILYIRFNHESKTFVLEDLSLSSIKDTASYLKVLGLDMGGVKSLIVKALTDIGYSNEGLKISTDIFSI